MVHVISDRGYYIIKPVQFFNFLGELSLVQNQKTEILNNNLDFRYPSTYVPDLWTIASLLWTSHCIWWKPLWSMLSSKVESWSVQWGQFFYDPMNAKTICCNFPTKIDHIGKIVLWLIEYCQATFFKHQNTVS